MSETPALDRRGLLRGAAAGAIAAVAVAPLEALAARSVSAAPAAQPLRLSFSPDYGPLYPTTDHTTGLELLALPRGFEYLTFGWRGDLMSDGVRTPGAHDGMAAYRRGDRVALVRNHEVGSFSGKFADPAYDPQAGGGTTTLTFDPDAGEEYLHGLTTDGEIFPFAANNMQIPAGGLSGRPAGHRSGRLPRLGVVRCDVRAEERQLAPREHPDARHHVRHHRSLAHRLPLTFPRRSRGLVRRHAAARPQTP